MEITHAELKNYLKVQEILETLYNLFYDLKVYPKYFKRIIRKLIQRHYRKILKTRNVCKERNIDYFIKKTKQIYNSVINLNTDVCDFDTLRSLDSLLYFCKRNRKRSFTSKFDLNTAETAFCQDCKIELKVSMVKFHVQGKKHLRNKVTDKFFCLKEDKQVLLQQGKRLIKQIIKEKRRNLKF